MNGSAMEGHRNGDWFFIVGIQEGRKQTTLQKEMDTTFVSLVHHTFIATTY
jgi:hypothetical protein